jgi:hypothetical protein
MLAGLPVFAAMPVVALETARAPRTVHELTNAMEELYADRIASARAFEDFPDGRGLVYRVTHGLWAKRGRLA